MQILVRLFGSLREEAGQSTLEIELADGSSLGALRAELAGRLVAVEKLGDRLAAAVNLEMAQGERILEDGDEVAFLPPVAGGGGLCTLSNIDLDPAEVSARVGGDDAGGLVTFTGAVRNRARGRDIRYLEYEAYPEMALREMEKISDQAAGKWPGTRVAIAHRTGHLEIGDLAVVIVAASPHRAEAFEACRYAIDTLKQTVPIWKKEVATDGQYWVDDHA